ncbi:MAG: radical SAM protein [Deltaproteobacteria bacterium]|jgi:hypothetical protein|nr:radical SAM protein [Deltaproteobacteria bacterium]
MSPLGLVNRTGGVQTILLERDKRYNQLMEERFGSNFTQYRINWAKAGKGQSPIEFPLSLDLAINSGCQLSCLMCPLPSKPKWKTYKPMDQGLFFNLMAQAREHNLPAVTFGLGSEPLLNPSVTNWIALAVNSGVMDIRLGTNGQALTPQTTQKIIDSGLTRLEISVDAAEAQTYAQIRRGGDFDKLTRAIEYFLELKTKKNLIFPLLRLSFLKLPQNKFQLKPFLKLWSTRVDMISIQKPLSFPEAELKLKRISKKTSPSLPPTPSFRPLCLQPWQRLSVDPFGGFWPCCSWYGETLLNYNALETVVSTLWLGPTITALRRALSLGRPPRACLLCLQSWG